MMTPDESLRRRNAFDANLVYGVRAFNEATGRDVHLAARKRKESRSDHVDPATGLVRQDLSFERACPLCGAKESTVLFMKGGFPHQRCAACNMVYVSPALREERLHSLYQGEDSYTRVLMNETQQQMDRKRFDYGLDRVEQHVPKPRRILDVGCGPGTFLEVAREREWDVAGIEFNSWCVQRLGELGIEVFDVPIERAQIEPGSFSCVSAWSLIEHVLDPMRLFAEFRRVLSDGGVLMLMVPNIDSLLVRVMHEKAATFCGEMHVNFFSPQTLREALRRSGFETLVCETFLTEIGTVNNHLSFEDPYLGDAPPLLEAMTPAWIHNNLMGSQLFAVARVVARP